MTHELVADAIQCPYCWQSIDVLIDCSVEQQEYIEDCQVCCRPIILNVSIERDNRDECFPVVTARSEDE